MTLLNSNSVNFSYLPSMPLSPKQRARVMSEPESQHPAANGVSEVLEMRLPGQLDKLIL